MPTNITRVRGVRAPADTPTPISEPIKAAFVKRFSPGNSSAAVTLHLHAEVRWHPGEPADLTREDRAEFTAAVACGIQHLAEALGVAAPSDQQSVEAAPMRGRGSSPARVTTGGTR